MLTVHAVDHVRRMRGGSQAHMLRCSDGHYYVVKFQNNPQGKRILVNELLGTLLAKQLGLPVQETAVVYVNDQIVQWSKGLLFHMPKGMIPCQAGLCFGSRYPVDDSSLLPLTVHDFVPEGHLQDVENLSDFAGMFVFDKWVCNTDHRQVIFARQDHRLPFRVAMIDQGSCFNAENWNFPDTPLYGIYRQPVVYSMVEGIRAFEKWIEALKQNIDEGVLRRISDDVPPEWYDGDQEALARLLQHLDRRRLRVDELLWSTRLASPKVFPKWSHPRRAMNTAS